MGKLFSVSCLIGALMIPTNGLRTMYISRLMSRRWMGTASFLQTDQLATAAEKLRNGGLVAFPTETVYGLGANALDVAAVESIFAAKKRPFTDPLIVHIASKDKIHELFDFSIDKTGNAVRVCEQLANHFWPGPLTVIYKASERVPMRVTANTGFVGLRIPRHPIARQLIELSGLPIAAPSANRFGHVSPTTAAHVMDDLRDEDVAIIVDTSSTPCDIGIESTVCRISESGDQVVILRCGAVTSADIERALSHSAIACQVIVSNERHITSPSPSSPAVAPGQMLKHYAPDIPTSILSRECQAEMTAFLIQNSERVMIIDFHGQLRHLMSHVKYYEDLSPSGDISEAYQNVFKLLRKSESLPISQLVLPDLRHLIDTNEKVKALWERLHRAASGHFLDKTNIRK